MSHDTGWELAEAKRETAALRQQLAAKAVELERLREAAEQCASKAMTHFGYYSSGREIAETLRAALSSHQEPSE